MIKKVGYIIVLTTIFTINTYAQITGKVLNKETKLPLENVLVQNIDNLQWTLTNFDGSFYIETQTLPTTLKFHLLGKIDTLITYKKLSSNKVIMLSNDNLTINEITVNAKRKKLNTGSNIVLEKQAINLVQAQSLADVMQLIPGKNISESQLHERQLLTLRTAIFSNNSKFNNTQGLDDNRNNNPFLINNSFGIGYVIDDVPINNNVNLTGSRGTTMGIFSSNLTENNSVGLGLDLKNISLDNIESIDIVQGISSARYGDHNTGLIKINKAHGFTPYKINTTLKGGSFQINMTKGFELPKNNGFINLGIDYLQSNEDPRNPISNFDRINSNVSWTYKEKGKLENNLTFSYSQSLNGDNTITNTTVVRSSKIDMKRFRLSNTGTKYFNNSFFNKLTSIILLDFSTNETSRSILLNNGGKPILNGLLDGTYETDYTLPVYTSIQNIDNKPFSFFSRLETQKRIETQKNTLFNITTGITLGIDKNFGKGNYSEIDEQFSNGVTTSGGPQIRNTNFNDIVPTDIKFSAYTTANIKSSLFSKKWITDIGVRYDNYNNQSSISPRLNTAIHFNQKLKTRFGIGLFAKSPSIQTLFPGKVYYDYLIDDFRTNTYSFALGHTFVREYKNLRIKPSKTVKFETGIDYSANFFNVSLTGYYNQQYDGYTNLRTFEIAELPEFDYTFYPDKKPDYIQIGTNKTILNYNKPTNALKAENLGVELILNTKKIKSINTSFNATASYRFTKTDTGLPDYVVSQDINSEAFIGLHTNIPQKFQTINSAITAIHHIADIGLVITLTAEQFIMAKNSNDNNVQFPYAYYDRDLNLISIPLNERSNNKYTPISKSFNAVSESSNNIPNAHTNYHLKLAKEFKNNLRFSFYAVNFLNHLPKATINNSDGTVSIRELNAPISFGGSISYKF